MSTLCELLKAHIDENKINMKDVAKAGDFNISSLRSAIYNNSLSFEKFCKVAIIVGFDLLKPIHFYMLKDKYELDPDDMKKRLTTYAKALKEKRLQKEDEITIDNILAEAQEDTANLALEVKMVAAAEKADQKKPIPVPESLDQEVEAVINNENNVVETGEVNELEPVEEMNTLLAINHMIVDMKGLDAFYIGSTLKELYQYKDKKSVEALKEARKCLSHLIDFLEA